MVPTIAIINKKFKKIGFLFIKVPFMRDFQHTSSKRVENNPFFSMEMVRVYMQILLNMSFLTKHLVGERTVFSL